MLPTMVDREKDRSLQSDIWKITRLMDGKFLILIVYITQEDETALARLELSEKVTMIVLLSSTLLSTTYDEKPEKF